MQNVARPRQRLRRPAHSAINADHNRDRRRATTIEKTALSPSRLHTRKPPGQNPRRLKNGASEEVRTLDIHLGKVVLYQLSYARFLEDEADNFNFPETVNAFLKNVLN